MVAPDARLRPCARARLRRRARTRHRRNYPGDIQRSVDGRFVYFANRGNDTIATFDVSGAKPVLVSELDSTVFWPQHLLVHGDHLLVAGWDSSRVVAMKLENGVPGAAVRGVVLYDAFACAPCRKAPTCHGRFDCLRALTPERVFDAVTGVLGMTTRKSLPVTASRGLV